MPPRRWQWSCHRPVNQLWAIPEDCHKNQQQRREALIVLGVEIEPLFMRRCMWMSFEAFEGWVWRFIEQETKRSEHFFKCFRREQRTTIQIRFSLFKQCCTRTIEEHSHSLDQKSSSTAERWRRNANRISFETFCGWTSVNMLCPWNSNKNVQLFGWRVEGSQSAPKNQLLSVLLVFVRIVRKILL